MAHLVAGSGLLLLAVVVSFVPLVMKSHFLRHSWKQRMWRPPFLCFGWKLVHSFSPLCFYWGQIVWISESCYKKEGGKYGQRLSSLSRMDTSVSHLYLFGSTRWNCRLIVNEFLAISHPQKLHNVFSCNVFHAWFPKLTMVHSLLLDQKL